MYVFCLNCEIFIYFYGYLFQKYDNFHTSNMLSKNTKYKALFFTVLKT